MKTSPRETRILQRLQPGVITRDGFMGTDQRTLEEIIHDDETTLEKIGVTAEAIADRMKYFMDRSFEAYLGPVVVDASWEVEYISERGRLVCPFIHPGSSPKGVIHLEHLTRKIHLCWTPLNVHLIRDHHFFQGVGSTYRIDPLVAVEALF